MPSGTIYKRLLSLPLFQGLSATDLSSIIETSRLGFLPCPSDEAIVTSGAPCRQLVFVMSGRVRVDTWNVSHTYHVVEYLPAPLMIEPERLFGLHQYHLHSYIAEETCRLLTIDKQDVMRIATTHLAVRLNLLNAIATKAQRHELQPWRPTPQTVDNHIVRFFATHALYPAGKKVYHIKMKQLASELNDSREDISRALHRLQSRGLVTLARGRIIVEALEACLRDG